MNSTSKSAVDMISDLMEDSNQASSMSGGVMSQEISPLLTINQTPYQDDSQHDEDCFSDEELKMAKKFIEFFGGDSDRAREIIDKASDCEECLGMIDNEEEDISMMAATMPETPDMPTMMGFGG